MATNRVTPDPGRLLAQLLDRGYDRAVAPVLRSLERNASGALNLRLTQLEDEAQRLSDAGERMTANNPVLRSVLADYEITLNRNVAAIDGAADGIQALGMDTAGDAVRQLSIPGVGDNELARVGMRWNTPDPEAVQRIVNYTTSDAWRNQLASYAESNLEVINNIALRGQILGRNPLRTAREISQTVNTLPRSTANTLMRTLQLQSYRDASVMHQLANEDILEPQVIRVATLDDRVCMACVALHGSLVPLGEVVQDHHQGRCIGIPVVRGRPRIIRSGPEWFDGLPEHRQLAIAGPGKLAALRDGRARFHDFVHHYRDPVFGRMLREGSLKAALAKRPATVRTVNGLLQADTGRPGTTAESLREFLRDSDGPLAQALWNEPGLIEQTREGATISVQGVRNAAKNFVRESQDITYGRDYLVDLAGDQARRAGLTVKTARDAEALLNSYHRTQAQAIREAARIGRVRLTPAQARRLDTAIDGNYLDMVYTTESSERGSLANRARRGRAPRSGMTDLEREIKRQEWIDRFNRDR